MKRVQSAVNALVAALTVVALLVLGSADVPAFRGGAQGWHDGSRPVPAQFRR